MSKYSDKRKARAMAAAETEAQTLAAIDAIETGVAMQGVAMPVKAQAAKPQQRRGEPVPLGSKPADFALAVGACLALARDMERTALELEVAAAKGIQRGEATSMAGMAKSLCTRIGELAERARRYAATWA